ncbi:hypothetical protein UlMin_002999 [Ulmus minor]
MGILYAMVARATWVLAEFNAAPTRNGAAVARKILYGDGPKNNTMASYTQGRFFFHLKRTDDVTVLCMVDENSGREMSFAFLDDIQQRFFNKYDSEIHLAPAYAMNEEFSRVLNLQMEHHSKQNNPNPEPEIHQERFIIMENIEKVMDKDESLPLLVHERGWLPGEIIRLRRPSEWRNFKLAAALLFGFLIAIYIVLAFFCHGPLLESCLK